MADRGLTADVHIREDLLHLEHRLHRLARGQVEDVDVGTARGVGEIGGDDDGQTLGVRRPRQVVGLHVVEAALLLDDPGPGVHELGVLAVEADADEIARLRVHVDDLLGAAQHELEVGEIVALVSARS